MLTQAAPAKLNLSLAVTGRRADGFHELVSLVASVQLFDRLDFTPGGPWRLTCDDPTLPVDGTNLVLKAAEAFRRHRPEVASGHFHLRKLIPSGAGLGGGSSDAAAALRALDLTLEDNCLGLEGLEPIAAEVGSDCPFFIRGISSVMRGRGERLELVPDPVGQALIGRRVLIAKPPFGIPTPEAYGLLIKSGRYADPSVSESELFAWMREPTRDPSTLGNTLEAPIFAKYLVLPTAIEAVSQAHGVRFRMTGSGSACFAFPDEGVDPEAVRRTLVRYWGAGTWFCDTRLSW